MDIDFKKIKEIHFIGIGGIGMSAIAEVLMSRGYKITGSDMRMSPICERLIKDGAEIHVPQSRANIKNPDLIVYTDAISEDNEELIAARKSGIQVVDRASVLGNIMKLYKNSIAITGTHGKTTTTSMLATIFHHTQLKPTILVGGNLDEIGGNVLVGDRDLLLCESCEYKGNILKYYPSTAVVLNIDEDHLDYYKSIYEIENTFIKFIEKMDENSLLIINADEANLIKIKNAAKGRVWTFGLHQNADFRAFDLKFDKAGYPSYKLKYKDQVYEVNLPVMGTHNVLNSLAAIATSVSVGLTVEEAVSEISQYKAVHQRLEKLAEINGITVMDDYAHHPTEIMASLNAVKNAHYNRVFCVFQPHTYTRTKILLNGFADSFKLADEVVVVDIYAAREVDKKEVHSKDLVKAMEERGIHCHYYPDFEGALSFLEDNLRPGDLFITMGAGDVNTLAKMYIEKNKWFEACFFKNILN